MRMELLLILSLLLLSIPSSISHYCTTVCMTKFQRSIAEITGFSDTSTLMAPFHKIIASTENNIEAHHQIRTLCSKVKSWESCIRSCSRDSARAILLSSMDQWKKFCTIMRKPDRTNNEYLNCERDYQRKVQKHCNFYIPSTFSVTVFCKSLEQYRECSDQFIHHCSDAAYLIKTAIDDAIQQSFSNLMKFATNRIRLPERCSMLHRTHHRKKHPKGEIVHRPALLTPQPSFTTALYSDIYSKEIQISKIETCNCDLDSCPQQCSTTSTSFPSLQIKDEPLDLSEKESQLLLNSYPIISQLTSTIFTILLLFIIF